VYPENWWFGCVNKVIDSIENGSPSADLVIA
jgi:hypothetical protein